MDTRRTSRTDPEPVWAVRLAEGLSVAAVLLGISSLTGWVTGIRLLASFGPEWNPTAPMTAAFSVALGLLSWMRARGRALPALSMVVTTAVLLLSALNLLEFLGGFLVGIENGVLPGFGSFVRAPVGRMSTLTAGVFLTTSLAMLLASLARRAGRLRFAEGVLASLSALVGFLIVLSYAYGTPLLYGGSPVRPVSLPTGLAVLALNLGTILENGLTRFPLVIFSGPGIRARLFRYFLPLVAAMSVLQGILARVLGAHPAVNPAAAEAAVSLLTAALAVGIVYRVGHAIGGQIETAEEALHESERKFRTIFDSASDGMFLFDLETRRFVMCNAMCSELLGFTQEEFVNLDIADLHPPEDLPFILEQIGKYTKGEQGVRSDIQFRRKDGTTFFTDISPSFVVLAGRESILVVFSDITERKRAEEEIRESREELRALARRVAQAEEGERARLARELHDQIGQTLSSIGVNLGFAEAKLPPGTPPEVSQRLEEAMDQVEQAGRAIRGVMSELRPLVLDDYGLVPALEWLAQQVSQRTGVRVQVLGGSPAARPGREVETALFRIAQEALTNISKHADASQAAIDLDWCADGLRMTVTDDGAGFDVRAVSFKTEPLHMGLVNMRERARSVGGTCRIESEPRHGTKVVVEVKEDSACQSR